MRLQPLVRAKVASLGDAGSAWVHDLPRVLAELSELWSVEIGRPLPGGSASYVARAVTAGGQDRVVKVAVPGVADLTAEARTLAAAEGGGYAILHAYDAGRRALLMESLGRSLDQLAWGPERKIATLADTLRAAWDLPLETAPEVRAGEDKASTLRRLVVELSARLGRPCSARVLTQALEYADRRAAAFDSLECVVVHGDPHPANALLVGEPRPGAESGAVFVDPDGFRCEPAYDLGVVLRDWSSQLGGVDARRVAEGYCALLSEHSGVDAQAIWEWGFLERVSTGLYVMSFGAEQVARPFLESAERLVD